MENANLTAAQALAEAGVRIFPAGPDKRPLFKQWQEIATTEHDTILGWWHHAPYALPAIPCGVNGLVVIDLDRHVNGSDGVIAFKALVARHGGLLAGVPMVKTPNNFLSVCCPTNGKSGSRGLRTVPGSLMVMSRCRCWQPAPA